MNESRDLAPDPELLAEAVEELERQIMSPVDPGTAGALKAVVELLRERPSVDGKLRRRLARRLWKELWAKGGWPSLGAVDERVAARVNVKTVTVRGWRFEDRLIGNTWE